jgi:micrococcal nuclease
MIQEKWVRNAKVVKVVDGDTIDCEVDLGFRMFARTRFRLARINAPETRGEERERGLVTKKYVTGVFFLPVEEGIPFQGCNVTIQSFKRPGKYGRWIAEVILKDGTNLSDMLVAEELAEYREY